MNQTNLGYTCKPLADISKIEPTTGYYLARIIRKASAKDANGLESQGAFLPIPTLDTYLTNDNVREYLIGCIQDLQTKQVRAITDSGRNVITDNDISPDALSSYLETTDENIGRISKDKINQWFMQDMADALTLAFADKMGISDSPTDEEATKLQQVVTQYRDCFGMLAAKAPSVSPTIGTNLQKALDMIPASAFTVKVSNILTKAMEQPSADMMAL